MQLLIGGDSVNFIPQIRFDVNLFWPTRFDVNNFRIEKPIYNKAECISQIT